MIWTSQCRSFCTRTKLWREASSHITFIACGPCLLSMISPPSRVAALGKVAEEFAYIDAIAWKSCFRLLGVS
uniref:Uncharacterized protein n=1 Tax=Salix viminalis TaxID=40686 RepID=A0A6N2KCV4_SALVM